MTKTKISLALNFLLLACAAFTAKIFRKPKQALECVDDMYIIRSQMVELCGDETASINIMDAILTVVTGAIVMGVGAMILAKIIPSVVGSDEKSNATISAIFSTAWDAIGLLPVALIVVAAVVIIGTVMLLANRA